MFTKTKIQNSSNKMFSKLFRRPVLFATGPVFGAREFDVPSKDYEIPKDDKETGMDRLIRMFKTE